MLRVVCLFLLTCVSLMGGGGLQASTLNDVFLLVFSLVSVPVHYVCNCRLWEWNKCHSAVKELNETTDNKILHPVYLSSPVICRLCFVLVFVRLLFVRNISLHLYCDAFTDCSRSLEEEYRSSIKAFTDFTRRQTRPHCEKV